MTSDRTLRTVEAAGEATTVVVVAVVIWVFVRPGVVVPLALSTQAACTPMVETADPVTIRIISEVEARYIQVTAAQKVVVCTVIAAAGLGSAVVSPVSDEPLRIGAVPANWPPVLAVNPFNVGTVVATM